MGSFDIFKEKIIMNLIIAPRLTKYVVLFVHNVDIILAFYRQRA